MASKEKKELIRKKENWQAFSNLVEKTMNDLKRATKFDEFCDIIDSFVYLGNKVFRGANQDEEIDKMIDNLKHFVDDARIHMKDLNNQAKPIINEIVEIYNSEYHGELAFNGDVEQWINRTFPLIRLYVNKKIKEGDENA